MTTLMAGAGGVPQRSGGGAASHAHVDPASHDASSTSALAAAEKQAKLHEAVTAILNRLDAADDGKFRNRRNGARSTYRRTEVPVQVYHPGGSTSIRAVATRNLSASGIGFLYSSFLHNGTHVEIVLQRRLGGEDRLKGKVVFCTHVGGVFHQVGVRFDQKIFPKLYLDGGDEFASAAAAAYDPGVRRAPAAVAPAAAIQPLPPVSPRSLTGTVLYIDNQQIDRAVMAHALRETAIVLTGVADERNALALLREGKTFDVVLCDVDFESVAREHAIRTLRTIGHRGPIGVVTAERQPHRLEAALEAGAKAIIAKPLEQDRVLAVLSEWLARPREAQHAPAPRPAEPAAPAMPLVSSLAPTAETAPQLARYVNGVKELGKELAAVAGDESAQIARIRQICLSLRSSGTSFGFQPLHEAAQDALRVIEATQSLEQSLIEVRNLADLCKRVAPPPKP